MGILKGTNIKERTSVEKKLKQSGKADKVEYLAKLSTNSGSIDPVEYCGHVFQKRELSLITELSYLRRIEKI